MIGRGTIVFRKDDGKNELHFTSPWGLSLGMHYHKDKMDEFDKRILANAEKEAWKPDDVVDDAELELIRKSRNACPGTEGYHKYASDAVYIIDLRTVKSC